MCAATQNEKHAAQVDFAGDTSGGFIFSEFQPAFDSMYAFGKLLEMLARSGLSIDQIAAEIPPAHIARAAVRCPWEVKGRVMRELTHELQNEGDVELIDGIKVWRDDQWALILPDASDPYFHIYAEGNTSEAARKLLDEYVARIEAMRG
jgi:mannose-1-phosphate guanylyltransferase/phosphomannomutase